jgi:hypothetical protein
MSALAALHAANQAGITMIVDGDKLRLEASAEPLFGTLDVLRCNKLDIVHFLRSSRHIQSWKPTKEPYDYET